MNIKIPQNAKVKLHWKTSPYDYSDEKAKEMIALASEKYNISKSQIVVDPIFLEINNEGKNVSVTHEIIENIQDPVFQQELFKTFIKENKIENYDFDRLKEIDAKINAQINYEVYDKYKNYTIKWVRWSNFLSYGTDNFFDFSSLDGIVLLNGEPLNQSGKTTLACDLLHFLLFGKTSKASVNEKVFNKNLPEATEVSVEGCIEIEGEEYVIKRTLNRPQLSKRTSKSKTTGKVEYYKVVGKNLEELEEYVENQGEENVQKTNKVIKEAIGNEADFDMIICATSSNLDDLIEKKDTERGHLLSKWIGLLPLEEKDVLARNEFNKNVKPYLYSNIYNCETLRQEVNALNLQKEGYEKKINDILAEIKEVQTKIESETKNKQEWESMKVQIDENISKLDIVTIEKRIETITANGKQCAELIKALEQELNDIGEINFVMADYDNLNSKILQLNGELATVREKCKNNKQQIEILKKGEYCPTCGRKLDNVNNTEAISKLEEEYQINFNAGVEKKKLLEESQNALETLKGLRDKFDYKTKLNLRILAEKAKKEALTSEYKDEVAKKKQYDGNQEALAKNNKCNNQILIIESNINNLRNQERRAISDGSETRVELRKTVEEIEKRNKVIEQIIEEQKLVSTWNLYLTMVGKDGVSKMVLRKVLPIINAQMHYLLTDICDFDVEIKINNKNDILFYLVKDGIESDLTSGSGFERTVASLALRAVLGKISRLPKLNGLVLDEIFGRVADANLDKMKTLLERIIADNYKYIINITHLSEAKDWGTQIVTITKDERGISKVSVAKAS